MQQYLKMTMAEPDSQADPILLIDQVGPFSNSQAPDLTLALTRPLTRSKEVHKLKNSPDLGIPEDHTLDNKNTSLTSITSSLTNLQRSQLDSYTVVDNFKDKMLKEVSSLTKNVMNIFTKLEYMRKAQAAIAINQSGQIQTNNFQLSSKIDDVNSQLSANIDGVSS